MPRKAPCSKKALAKIALQRAKTALLIERSKLAKLRADATPDAADFTGATLAERMAGYDPTPEERAMIEQRLEVLRGRLADGTVKGLSGL